MCLVVCLFDVRCVFLFVCLDVCFGCLFIVYLVRSVVRLFVVVFGCVVV